MLTADISLREIDISEHPVSHTKGVYSDLLWSAEALLYLLKRTTVIGQTV